MKVLATLALLGLAATGGYAQPTLPNLPGANRFAAANVAPTTLGYPGLGVGGVGLQQQWGAGGLPVGVGGVGLQQPIVGGFGLQQPIVGGFGLQQPIMGGWQQGVGVGQVPVGVGLGGLGLGMGQVGVGTIPAMNLGVGAIPTMAGIGGATFPTTVGAGSIIGPVLPQDFGAPAAQFGTLQQPILSVGQAQNLLPYQQMQQALNARVAALGAGAIPTSLATGIPSATTGIPTGIPLGSIGNVGTIGTIGNIPAGIPTATNMPNIPAMNF